MPKYYCDYCDIYLTHDSPSVRKSHNEGWKHKNAVRAYYSQFEENHTQYVIDQKIKLYEQKVQGGGVPFAYPPGMFGPPPMGAPPGVPPPEVYQAHVQQFYQQQAQSQQGASAPYQAGDSSQRESRNYRTDQHSSHRHDQGRDNRNERSDQYERRDDRRDNTGHSSYNRDHSGHSQSSQYQRR